MSLFAPRDPAAAGRALQAVLAVVAVVLAGYTLLDPPDGLPVVQVWVVVAGLVVAAGLLRLRGDRVPAWVFGALPVAGAGTLAVLDVATHDASAAAQVFFLLPVVFAAGHLRPAGAWVVSGASMLAEAVTTLLLLPTTQALTDTAYLTAVAVVTTVLLVRANGRTEVLLAELRHLAAVDPLTGLVTRRVLDDAASCALAAADARAGTSFVVVDVDRFKGVNDHFGHPVGDDVLVHVARTLQRVAGSDAVVSRLGGDELAALLPGTPAAAARRRAEAVAAEVRRHPLRLDDGRLVAVTVSIGVAHAPDHAADLPGLYRAADLALYEAKRAGRDQVAVAGPGPAPTPPRPRPEPRPGALPHPRA